MVGDDASGANENSFRVGASSNEARDSGGFVESDLLILLHRVLVAANLSNHGIAEAQSLVAMLLHVLDVDILSFGDVN